MQLRATSFFIALVTFFSFPFSFRAMQNVTLEDTQLGAYTVLFILTYRPFLFVSVPHALLKVHLFFVHSCKISLLI